MEFDKEKIKRYLIQLGKTYFVLILLTALLAFGLWWVRDSPSYLRDAVIALMSALIGSMAYDVLKVSFKK